MAKNSHETGTPKTEVFETKTEAISAFADLFDTLIHPATCLQSMIETIEYAGSDLCLLIRAAVSKAVKIYNIENVTTVVISNRAGAVSIGRDRFQNVYVRVSWSDGTPNDCKAIVHGVFPTAIVAVVSDETIGTTETRIRFYGKFQSGK